MGADQRHADPQKCYSSSKTLKAYEQEAQMHYAPEMVEYVGQGKTQLRLFHPSVIHKE